MGRLMPAITSTLPACISEIARFEGVPPNRSVSTITPSPLSTRLIASAISRRRFSMSSLGPIQTPMTSVWRPTTCSIAWMNSSASAPWVTIIRPIMNCFGSEGRDRRSFAAIVGAQVQAFGTACDSPGYRQRARQRRPANLSASGSILPRSPDFFQFQPKRLKYNPQSISADPTRRSFRPGRRPATPGCDAAMWVKNPHRARQKRSVRP